MHVSLSDIQKITAFKDTNNKSSEQIREIATRRFLKKNEVLFLEKDRITCFYAILDGKVSLSRYSSNGQKRVFFILSEGELVNEVVFDELPVSVVCEGFEDTCILEFKKQDFLKIMENDFSLTMNILNSIGRKQRRLYRQLKNTVPIKMDKRLAAKLWKLSKDYGIDQGEWTIIDLKITITYLSYMLGSSRETISRAMKVLLESDFVQWEEKKLMVKEKDLRHYFRSP